MNIKQRAENYAELFRLVPEVKGWHQQKVDDFTAGYEAALKDFSLMDYKQLQAYKEGFNAALESLKVANDVVQHKHV